MPLKSFTSTGKSNVEIFEGNHSERHHIAIKKQNPVTSGLVISYSELTCNCNLLEQHIELSVAHKRTDQR